MNNLEHEPKDDIVWRDGEIVLNLEDFKKRLIEDVMKYSLSTLVVMVK